MGRTIKKQIKKREGDEIDGDLVRKERVANVGIIRLTPRIGEE
jgi:hypothetical protein